MMADEFKFDSADAEQTAQYLPSTSGITEAHRAYPDLRLFVASAYDDLAARFGNFQAVLSLEVVEHVYYPLSEKLDGHFTALWDEDI
jgi:hypothetical protein